MRVAATFLACGLLLVTSACATGPAASTPAGAGAQRADAGGEAVSCTYERPVGTNIPKKICMTDSQRRAAREQATQTLQDLQGSGGSGGRDAGR